MANIVGKLLLALIISLMSTAQASKPKTLHFEFYMQDYVGGPNPTAIPVARRLTNITGLDQNSTFGTIFVIDNPITAGPEENSTALGRAQGTGSSTSMEEFSFLLTVTYKFTNGPYKGSSLSVIGRNPVQQDRELAIVGGTGLFRLARGYANARTLSFSMIHTIVGYNVTLVFDY